MATQRPGQVSDRDMAARFGVEYEEFVEAEESQDLDDPTALRPDESAPRGGRTINHPALVNEIIRIACARYPNDRWLNALCASWELQLKLMREFRQSRQREERWGVQDFRDWFREISKSLENPFGEFIPVASQVRELQERITAIREEVLADDALMKTLLFRPMFNYFVYMKDGDGHRRGEVMMKNDEKVRKGNFAEVEITNEFELRRIPFVLGLPQGFHVLSASGEDSVFELRHCRARIADRGGFYKLERLDMQTYEDAVSRSAQIQAVRVRGAEEAEKYRDANAHPEIFDLEREKRIDEHEHTSFGCIFKGLAARSRRDFIQKLKKMTVAQVSDLPLIMVLNKGDNKRRGVGLAGGDIEPKKFRGIVQEDVKKLFRGDESLVVADDLFEKVIGHLCREVVKESGHEILQLHGRIYRVQKGENHADHFWLASATKDMVEVCKETSEIEKTIYPTVRDLFRMLLGDKETLRKYDHKGNAWPYFWHGVALVVFFKREGVPMCEEMVVFLRDAEKRKRL